MNKLIINGHEILLSDETAKNLKKSFGIEKTEKQKVEEAINHINFVRHVMIDFKPMVLEKWKFYGSYKYYNGLYVAIPLPNCNDKISKNAFEWALKFMEEYPESTPIHLRHVNFDHSSYIYIKWRGK